MAAAAPRREGEPGPVGPEEPPRVVASVFSGFDILGVERVTIRRVIPGRTIKARRKH